MEQVWSCQISRKTEGPFQASIGDLTVGETFYLRCKENEQVSTSLDQKKSSSPLENEQPQTVTLFLQQHPWSQYVLKPLKTLSLSDEHILLEVTSYIPGNYNANQELLLQKGDYIIALEGFSWNTKSSLQQQTAQLQPNPIYGPIRIPSPYLEIVFWVLGFLTALTIVFFIVRKIKKHKDEFDDIENLKTLRSPLYEFYHEARKIEKRYLTLSTDLNQEEKMKSFQKEPPIISSDFYKDLSRIFRKFLAVQLEFPAHIWSVQRSLKHLKKRYFDPELLKHIKSLFYELSQMASTKGTISQKECHQNLSFCKDIASQIAHLQKRKDI